MQHPHLSESAPARGILYFVFATALFFCLAGQAFADDPSAENSWRYQNGVDVTALDAGAGGSLEEGASDAGVELQALGAYNIFGVDVSYHNKSIDWAAAKADGVSYAIVRCGYGMDLESQDDSQWLANVRGCQRNGIPLGVYLYSYATNTDRAHSEAEHVLRQLDEAGLSPSDLELPIYFDMEDDSTADLSSEELAAIFQEFESVLHQAGYQNVGVYANASWWRDKLTDIDLDPSLKWIARYYSTDPYTPGDGYSTTPFAGRFSSLSGSAHLWQYSSVGSVDGIDTNVDVDLADADFEDAFLTTDSGFSDVSRGQWFFATVNKAARLGYMTGYGDSGSFGPDKNLTRAEAAAVIYKMSAGSLGQAGSSASSSNAFSDVHAGDWFASTVAWANANGIVQGSNGSFRPNDPVTREEFATMLARYVAAQQKATDGSYADQQDIATDGSADDYAAYDDAALVSDYAEEAIGWAVKSQVMGVGTTTLNPQGNITRAEAAAMSVRCQPVGL